MSAYKLKLLRGAKVNLGDIWIQPLTLGQIEEIGISRYYRLLNICNIDKRDIFTNISYDYVKDMSIFDVLIINDQLRNMFIDFIQVFICNDGVGNVEYIPEINEISITYQENLSWINKENLEDILDVVRMMYCIDKKNKESDRDDVDEDMRRILKEFEEEESKVKSAKGININLMSIIAGVSTKHPSINLLNIWEYTVYQLMYTYRYLNNIDNENRVVSAVYAGTVDGKKIDLEKIHWANEI